ncbi:hypothetical protein [Catenovulum adriaticum]|uniref:Uncharacterized protein n=1 Tax=Catenovulum adriaticum TaxID=2984846 RepID=A0ABY7AN83_9ALTE|nr:hypothetical protein [Catenovulum sp. TS8]WAJ69746.1 hypothetical protein OLW01_11355 [Catenovulum sp. TS8]
MSNNLNIDASNASIELIHPKRMNKVGRVLYHLYQGGTLNRFEAEEQLHDHCLNSTISKISNDLGVVIERKTEVVIGYQGHKSPCKRYSINSHPNNMYMACKQLVCLYGFKIPMPD